MKAANDPVKAAKNAGNTTVLEDNELGDVKIHENVIADLVRRAALTVEGISRLAGNALVDNIAEIVGSRRMQARAVSVDMSEENKVAIEVKLNVLVGYRLPDVAEQVQKKVINAVEHVTGMTVTRVNVLIQEIDDPDEDDDADDDAAPAAPLH